MAPGIVQDLHNLAANQILTVTELTRLQMRGPRTFRIQS
jgi:hypothetical protein